MDSDSTISLVRTQLVLPLELSIADTKVLAIFSFIGINTANINDLYGISAINIAIVVYIPINMFYEIKGLIEKERNI